MPKITINNIGTLEDNSALAKLNENFQTIVDEFDNVPSRDGTSPSAMTADLDMNSNQILNLPDATTDQEPLTYGQFNVYYADILSKSAQVTSDKAAVESLYDQFDDRYLGSKSVAPSADNDGNTLLVGAIYWNTVTENLYFWNGSAWESPVLEAATSATSAATSETNAALSASAASTSESNASTSETNAATSESNAAASASAASTSASNASTSETNASNSASAASTSASNASTSETNAANSASSAATSASNAAASYDSFDDRYLGAKASDPSVDNDGDALVTGALYWNTSTDTLKAYNGSLWSPITVFDQSLNTTDSVTFADLTVNGNVSVTGTVDGRDVSSDGSKLDGIEALADVTDTANVTAAGAVMDSELTSEASVKAIDQGLATTDSPTFAGLTVDTDTFYVDSTNNRIGIGTTNPSENLDVAGNAEINGNVRTDEVAGRSFGFGTATFSFDSTNVSYYGLTHTRPTGEFNTVLSAFSNIKFTTGGAERLRISSSGSALFSGFVEVQAEPVASSSPNLGIRVVGNASDNGQLQFTNNAKSAVTGSILCTASEYNFDRTGAYPFTFVNNGSERLRIDGSGNVGIGTTNPNYPLEVNGTIKTKFQSDGNGTVKVGFSTAAAIEVVASDSGPGTFAPQMLLHNTSSTEYGPYWNSRKTRGLAAANSGDKLGTFVFQSFDSGGTERNAALFSASSAGAGASHHAAHFDFTTINTSGVGAVRMRINSEGNVGIGTTSPNANAILDVTSTTKAFMPPRMTTAQRDAIASPAAGMVVYNTTTNVLNFHNGTAWGAV